jgi:valyl-tRNA synthetase
MDKNYAPSEFEGRIYREWTERGYFRARVNPDKKPFTVMMPPPNVTGQLHMGHALNNTLPDSIIRYKRMRGFEALWLPGTDHASIATEMKVVEKMKADGLTKADTGREGFIERAWDWTRLYGGRIIEQLKRLGCGCDWDRLAFTLDEPRSRAVNEAFIRLYKDGLIYKGDRIINWCPECKTAISDAEVEFKPHNGRLWHLRYRVKGEDAFITVATTRPETMLGDTAVAVNPADTRYTGFVGKTLILPLVGREIPVIADDYVDKAFGSGAVKITPAHDPNDFEVGLRHKLEVIRVMDDGGAMNENAGAYAGLDRYAARDKILADLKKAGVLVKTEKHAHNAGHCYRCDTVIEPIVSRQWFVRMKDLAAPAVAAVEDKRIKLTPKRFEKIYLHWMRNIRDWCISRQLWWGHRIPAYYCDKCGRIAVAAEPPAACACGCTAFTRDPDVLDTWFSSALWPFSTLGFPDKTPDLEYFYPTDLLITAYDIIFFWVARMIFSGLYNMGEIPFKQVLFTGLVRDSRGQKMSKSAGNGIDPLELIDKYGADSLRFSLLNGVAAGGDMRYGAEKTEAARNFVNKVWNAARFFLGQIGGGEVTLPELKDCVLSAADKWILTALNNTARRAARYMDRYDAGAACALLYDFFWGELCDWYIELLKPALYSENETERLSALSVFLHVYKAALKMLHPIIPFVTEEIYRALPRGADEPDSIMLCRYPEYDKRYVFTAAAAAFDKIRGLIRSVRNLRSELNVPQTKRIRLYILPLKAQELPNECIPYIKALTYSGSAELIGNAAELEGRTSVCLSEIAEAYVYTDELIDTEKERVRLSGEIEDVLREIARAEGKLANPGFIAKAPEALVAAEREKLVKYAERLQRARSALEGVNNIG